MAKVYRLHEGQDGTGWFSSNPITNDQLKTIVTAGTDVATSIPSPFARIDLVKSAFRWVAENGIEGATAQHKLVSDALDVAQLFFLYPKHKNKIRIVSWSPIERFNQLSQDTNTKHSTFANTLDIFWRQDGEVYNFDQVNRLYLVLNSATNQVIGGTSPATLFFAAPDVKVATEDLDITCGHDILFDDIYYSLANRDKSFVEYIFTLSKQRNFANNFPELYSYLQVVRNKIENPLKSIIANLTADNIEIFSPCPVLDNNMDPCEVLGIRLGVQANDANLIENESDFVIVPALTISGLKPLVLPNDKFTHRWTYTTNGVLWNSNNQIPTKNEFSNSNSVLPVQGNHYPWLSIGNFLEETIIELPYSIDSTKFKTCGAKKHLLPLTPTFFKYFKAENVSNYINIDELAGGGLEVKLEIPVRGGTVTFKKTYHKSSIVKIEVHLAILPFVKIPNVEIDYTFGLQDFRYDRSQDIHLESYETGSFSDIRNSVLRRLSDKDQSIYYKSKKFDTIRFKSNDLSGFIVPNMPDSIANQQVSFAIDFGTTNTHIEYKHGTNAEKALDVTADLPIWQSLIDRNREVNKDPLQIRNDDIFEREIFPYQFNKNTNYKFPFRTALTYNQNINFNEPIEVFTHTNNFFLFEKIFYSNYLQLHTKLKWSNYTRPEDKILVEKYIECLLHIIFYKTLLLNGHPQNTKVTWFYPVSMDSYEYGIFKEVWEKAYKKIFCIDNTNNINAIPESIAPYLHYRSIYPGLSLSIDIGGGSSDIAVFKNANDLPEFISSFKFAGNAIFGDGFPNGAFSNSSDNNGFVKSYFSEIDKAIGSNNNRREILNDIIQKRKDSADFSSFLFSLETETDIQFNYTTLLRQDRKMKLPILMFYGAVIYYSANLMKKHGMVEIPKNILLSGTASKTIKIIDSINNLPNTSKLFKYIFESVMGVKTDNLNIVLSENPKEITCKGVLRAGINEDITNCPMVFWLGGDNDSVWSKALNKNTDIPNTPYYRDLESGDIKSLIENSITDFFSLLDNYFKQINFEGDFGIDNEAYLKFKEMRSQNIRDFLEHGIKAFYKSPDKHIEETLFFYPLIGILNKLAFELSNSDNQ